MAVSCVKIVCGTDICHSGITMHYCLLKNCFQSMALITLCHREVLFFVIITKKNMKVVVDVQDSTITKQSSTKLYACIFHAIYG